MQPQAGSATNYFKGFFATFYFRLLLKGLEVFSF